MTRSTMGTRTAAGLVFLFAMPAMAQNSMDNINGTHSTMAAPKTFLVTLFEHIRGVRRAKSHALAPNLLLPSRLDHRCRSRCRLASVARLIMVSWFRGIELLRNPFDAVCALMADRLHPK